MRFSGDYWRYLQGLAVITAALGVVGYLMFYTTPADWEADYFQHYQFPLILSLVILLLLVLAFRLGPKVGPIRWKNLQGYLVLGLLILGFQAVCYALVLMQGAGMLSLSESVLDFVAMQRWGYLYAIGFLAFLRKTEDGGGSPLR